MRKLSLRDIQNKLEQRKVEMNRSVAEFREKSKAQGWPLSRNRPRSADEVKALNNIAVTAFRRAVKSGSIHYDKESRVLIIEKLRKS